MDLENPTQHSAGSPRSESNPSAPAADAREFLGGSHWIRREHAPEGRQHDVEGMIGKWKMLRVAGLKGAGHDIIFRSRSARVDCGT